MCERERVRARVREREREREIDRRGRESAREREGGEGGAGGRKKESVRVCECVQNFHLKSSENVDISRYRVAKTHRMP